MIDLSTRQITSLYLLVIALVSILLPKSTFSLSLSAGRCVIQLIGLGFILFLLSQLGNEPSIYMEFATITYLVLMSIIGSFEGYKRCRYHLTKFSIFYTSCSLPPAIFAISLVWYFLEKHAFSPFMDPLIIIPIFGMFLSNVIASLCIWSDGYAASILRNIDEVRLWKSVGADMEYATLSEIKTTTNLTLSPIANYLSLIGLVAIPGMMTGSLVSGDNALIAAKYQIFVMLGITLSQITGIAIFKKFVISSVKLGEVREKKAEKIDLLLWLFSKICPFQRK